MALRNEEAKIKQNMVSWVALSDLSKRLHQDFPDLKDPIDLGSYRAKNQLDCSKLIMHHDIHIIQVHANMMENYKQICRCMEEAQEAVDQLKKIDKYKEKLSIMKDVFEGLDKPRADWEKTIKRLAAMIQRLG